jgi:hypothetical protein
LLQLFHFPVKTLHKPKVVFQVRIFNMNMRVS